MAMSLITTSGLNSRPNAPPHPRSGPRPPRALPGEASPPWRRWRPGCVCAGRREAGPIGEITPHVRGGVVAFQGTHCPACGFLPRSDDPRRSARAKSRWLCQTHHPPGHSLTLRGLMPCTRVCHAAHPKGNTARRSKLRNQPAQHAHEQERDLGRQNDPGRSA
jgi:hypothetical protein